MTKHDPVENSVKCSLTIEDGNKMSLNMSDQVVENVAKLYNPDVLVEQEPKLKVVRLKKASTKRSRLCRATQSLYNLESGNEPEKPLHIELDLYQMETC